MARVWPGLIVSPETVAKRVNLLREALGDDAQEPRYIAGVRSRGYRLVAAVSPAVRLAPTIEGSLSAPAVVTQPNELSTSDTLAIEPRTVTTKPRRIWWLVLPVLLAAIFTIAIDVRTVHRVPAVGAQPIPQNPLRDTEAIGARARTVAVLPFDNISADAADAYLAQGLPEMILNRLSRIEGLSVIARNSSFAIANQEHRFKRDRPTSQFRISDRWQRATRDGSVAGGSAPRGYAPQVPWFGRPILIAVCTTSSVSRMRLPTKSLVHCRRALGRLNPSPQPVPAARIWKLISPS